MPGNHLTAHALSTRGLCMILVKRDVSYRTKWPLPTEALCLFPTVFMPVCHSSPCPQFSQERSAVIYLHYHQSNREEKIMTVPTMTTNKPTWPSLSCTAQGTPLLPCNSHRRSAPPPAVAPPPAPAHGPDLCLGLGKLHRAWSLWPCHLPVPGAARPGPARPAEQVGTGRAGERQGLGAGAEARAAWGSEALPGPGRGRGRLESRGGAVRADPWLPQAARR